MGNSILFMITMLFIAILIKFIYDGIKKAETIFEKIIDFFMGMIMIVILILYYIDRFDVPSQLGWNENINTQNWLNVIGNYITGIISAIIGAVTSLYIMRYQIVDNNKNAEKRDKENLRIQNMPLLKYDCKDRKNTNIGLIQLESIFNEDESVCQSISFCIKNIGLNTTRKIWLNIHCDILQKEYNFDLHNYGVIEEKQEIVIPFVLRLKTNQTYIFEITLYYQDLLQNYYEQKIFLKYELSSKNDGLNYYFNSSFEVKDEERINKLPEDSFEKV